MAKHVDVDLGFAEECDEKWRLLCHYFPSKIGGKPAWLSLDSLPMMDSISCKNCGNPCSFLAQIYSPVEDREDCFHRTVYIFVCPKGDCCKLNDARNIVVFRSQLKRENKFYSTEPPNENYFDENADYPRVEQFCGVCVVCGCRGDKKCSQCHSAVYCSKQHQVLHWKNGHKLKCSSSPGDASEASEKLLFPEYEIVIEPEKEVPQSESKSEEQKMEEYKEYMSKVKDQDELSTSELDSMAVKDTKADEAFENFKQRISHEPEQIIRYERNGTPLWVSSDNIPRSEDIPKCLCGAPRQFEFQVLPQLLTYLDVDKTANSIDWGTLAVYTCSVNCNTSNYVQEFVWKQDFS